jgi:hypothetical protein
MNQTIIKNLKSRLKQMEGEVRSDIEATSVDLGSINQDGWHDAESRAEMIVSQEVALELKERQTIRLLRIQNALNSIQNGTYAAKEFQTSAFRHSPKRFCAFAARHKNSLINPGEHQGTSRELLPITFA